jgi:hypothetical protein
VALVSLASLCIHRQEAAQGPTDDHEKVTPPVTNGRASSIGSGYAGGDS